ncbi:MAG: ribonuclease D [Gammaproteobacteria bacterium]
MTSIQYIDTPAKLGELCRKIKNETWLALDTEFLREKTYYPKFCLLQIATPEWVACVDPFALSDLSELFDAIYDPSITKVLHSCRQDLEIFYKITGNIPGPIFDTQVAAPLLGFQDNPGYAMLVSSFLNINLSKAHTRTDWTVRPLSEEQLQYAADDVIYLCRVYQIMMQKLKELNRLVWLENDFAQLYNPELYEISPENAWQKIRGKNKLTGRQLSIVQALSKWREETAQTEDRPRNWLLRDDLLIELAKLQPTNPTDLAAVRNVNERTINRYGRTICRLINEAKQTPPRFLDEKDRSAKKTPQQEAVLDIFTALVRIRADENSLNPSILASRKDLELLLFDDTHSQLLKGWRYSMVGRELVGLLKGEQLLGIRGEKVVSVDAKSVA